MFMAKYVLLHFILPPGIFITCLLLIGLWFLLKKNRVPGVVTITIACIMWLTTISPLTNIVYQGLESGLSVPGNPKGDVIIILGGGADDEVPDMSGIGAPSGMMLSRMVTAIRLQNRLEIPIIISGGSVYKDVQAEAPIVKRYLVDLGIPDELIIEESESRNTLENAKFSHEICLQQGFENPILITSAYHMRRALMLFRHMGADVIPFPADFHSSENRHYGWQNYLPGSFQGIAMAIREYMALLYYHYTI